VRLAVAPIIAAAVLLFWGSVFWGVAKLFRRKWHSGNVVFSFPVILVIWLGLVGQASVRRENNPDAPGILATAADSDAERADARDDNTASTRAGGDERLRAQFSEWFRSYATAVNGRVRAARAINDWSKLSEPASPDGVAKLANAARAAGEHQQAAQRLSPIDDDDVEEATSLLEDSARELRTCINMTQTVMGTLEAGRVQQRADRADEHCIQSDRLLKRVSRTPRTRSTSSVVRIRCRASAMRCKTSCSAATDTTRWRPDGVTSWLVTKAAPLSLPLSLCGSSRSTNRFGSARRRACSLCAA
jgi:hypothetical protein